MQSKKGTLLYEISQITISQVQSKRPKEEAKQKTFNKKEHQERAGTKNPTTVIDNDPTLHTTMSIPAVFFLPIYLN